MVRTRVNVSLTGFPIEIIFSSDLSDSRKKRHAKVKA